MTLKYFRLPQDASDPLHLGNEKEENVHQHQSFSWKSLILSLLAVVNFSLTVSIIVMLREKPTPDGFGETRQAIRVRGATDRSQPRWTLLRRHGTSSGGIRLTVPKTTQTATTCGKPFYRPMVSWLWTENGRSRDSGRRRCTYRAITAKVSTCWKPIISCTVW